VGLGAALRGRSGVNTREYPESPAAEANRESAGLEPAGWRSTDKRGSVTKVGPDRGNASAAGGDEAGRSISGRTVPQGERPGRRPDFGFATPGISLWIRWAVARGASRAGNGARVTPSGERITRGELAPEVTGKSVVD
jgi:hypothetical protein